MIKQTFLYNECPVCGGPKTDKYTKTCSHKCGAILMRTRMKNDPIAYEKFVNKVKENQSKIWTNRKESNDNSIREKIGKTISIQRQKMTVEEDGLSLTLIQAGMSKDVY